MRYHNNIASTRANSAENEQKWVEKIKYNL